ncbi:hypothetical protein ABZZ20_00690 [Streptomyces sp. NPDC006430]|uniref:hypothetical protein n=1 Tax=Streptomyces sp. NPDC006430 TaxID=3154299 RepID=UPI0033B7F553
MFPIARLAARSLTAVLLSTALAWGPLVATAASAPPGRVETARSIELSPTHGLPGTRIVVRGYGFEDCHTYAPYGGSGASAGDIHVTWEGANPSVTRADLESGEFETDVTAPSDATPGGYDVTATCTLKGKGHLTATSTFTVELRPEPAAEPRLALEPSEGTVQTSIRVAGSGFDRCAANDVDGGTGTGVAALRWDNSPVEAVAPEQLTVEDGTFTAGLPVPDDAAPGVHTITAVCVGYGEISAEAPFTVTPGAGTEQNPTVTLDPTSGPAGTARVTVSGSGFNCSTVDLLWDGEPLDTHAVSDDGTFTAALGIRPGAAEGDYTLLARCTAEPEQAAEATFSVTGPTRPGGTEPGGTQPGGTQPGQTEPGGTQPGQTDPGGADPGRTDPGDSTPIDVTPHSTNTTTPVGWVVGPSLLGVLLLAAAGFVFLSRAHRGPRWVHEHVSAQIRPTTAMTDLTEPDRDTDRPTRTVRLEPHEDPGDQTFEEER